MKKIVLLILLLTFSQKITYAFDLITVPKDISKLNIFGITFDSQIADIEKLEGLNISIRDIHYPSADIKKVSITYNISPESIQIQPKDQNSFNTYLENNIMISLFDGQVYSITVGLAFFRNIKEVVHHSTPRVTDKKNDTDINNSKLIKKMTDIYGEYEIFNSPYLTRSDLQLVWQTNNFYINYSSEFRLIEFLDKKILISAIRKSKMQNKLENVVSAKINANRVAFRDQARTSSRVLARLNKGELLTNLEKIYSSFEDGGGADGFPVAIGPWRALWYKVCRSNGQEGYVYGWFLDPVE